VRAIDADVAQAMIDDPRNLKVRHCLARPPLIAPVSVPARAVDRDVPTIGVAIDAGIADPFGDAPSPPP